MSTVTIENCLLFGLTAFALTSAGCHSANNGEKVPSQAAVPAYYKYLSGSWGDRGMVLQLIKYPGGYEGVFTDDSLAEPFSVSGEATGGDTLRLVVYDHYNWLDTFRGSFSQPGLFRGTATDTAGLTGRVTLQERYDAGTIRWQVYVLNDSLAFDTSAGAPKARFRSIVVWPEQKDLPAGVYRLLTDSISGRLFGADSLFNTPAALLEALRDSFFQSYRAMSEQFGSRDAGGVRATFNWEADYDMRVLWNADSLISLSATNYQYTGGAHGLTSTSVMSVDWTGDALQLTDIFRKGFEAPLQAILEKHLRQQYDLGADVPLNGRQGMLFNAHLPLTSNCFLTAGGIGFVYNPYEVAPGNYGVITLFVPRAEVSDLLQ